ncbi:MAG: hypothetical protein VYD19_10905, partial [Myxococcota bacterium]|nr:hypothetical protein [Myxococcota bacterium]
GLYACSPVVSGIEGWRTLNQCEDDSVITFENGDARCESWACQAESAVAFCQISGMGHHFPGTASFPFCDRPRSQRCMNARRELGAPSEDLSNEQIWDFLSAHSLP